MKLIETYLLKQFVAVAKCGTLLGASEMLHISQPTLSRAMKRIEGELGVSLFHRENSKISLSETGKVAAEYAERALTANQELIERVLAFDRSLRTVNVGSCSPFPMNEIMRTLQERLPGKTIASEIVGEDKMISGLKNHMYQICILHTDPDDKNIFCQRFMEENLYISISEDHPLAEKKSITFEELRGIRILMNGNVGFWMDICREKLSESDLLIQSNPDAMAELVEASSLPLFNSDQFIARGLKTPGRVSIPISDPEAHATYWLACLAAEQKTYRSIYNAVRGNLLHNN